MNLGGAALLFAAALLLCGQMAKSPAQQGQENEGTRILQRPYFQKKNKIRTGVNVNALIQETQKIVQKADQITLVWWIPEEFWRISSAQNTTVTEAQTEELIKVLRPYILIIVVDGGVGPFGTVTYSSEADTRAGIQIKDSQGTCYRPLNEDNINVEGGNLLAIIKPIFVNMLGPMGQNMHLFLFAAGDEKGQRIAEAKKPGAFSVKLGDREFRWRLPLGSLLEPKICSKCKEKCSGSWNFCPWCGTGLPK